MNPCRLPCLFFYHIIFFSNNQSLFRNLCFTIAETQNFRSTVSGFPTVKSCFLLYHKLCSIAAGKFPMHQSITNHFSYNFGFCKMASGMPIFPTSCSASYTIAILPSKNLLSENSSNIPTYSSPFPREICRSPHTDNER